MLCSFNWPFNHLSYGYILSSLILRCQDLNLFSQTYSARHLDLLCKLTLHAQKSSAMPQVFQVDSGSKLHFLSYSINQWKYSDCFFLFIFSICHTLVRSITWLVSNEALWYTYMFVLQQHEALKSKLAFLQKNTFSQLKQGKCDTPGVLKSKQASWNSSWPALPIRICQLPLTSWGCNFSLV